MDASQIADVWNVFKDNIDKKNIEQVAESYVDTCADYGAEDHAFRDAMGNCDYLDAAINYYLDETADEMDSYDEDVWDD